MSSFSRKYRLLKKHDFQSVFAKSHKSVHKFIIALYQQTQHDYGRLGIMLSKRHLPRAVDRNTLRRVIRESFRHHHDALKGLDIIILLRSECTPLDRKALRTDIDYLWQKVLTNSSRRGS